MSTAELRLITVGISESASHQASIRALRGHRSANKVLVFKMQGSCSMQSSLLGRPLGKVRLACPVVVVCAALWIPAVTVQCRLMYALPLWEAMRQDVGANISHTKVQKLQISNHRLLFCSSINMWRKHHAEQCRGDTGSGRAQCIRKAQTSQLQQGRR